MLWGSVAWVGKISFWKIRWPSCFPELPVQNGNCPENVWIKLQHFIGKTSSWLHACVFIRIFLFVLESKNMRFSLKAILQGKVRDNAFHRLESYWTVILVASSKRTTPLLSRWRSGANSQCIHWWRQSAIQEQQSRSWWSGMTFIQNFRFFYSKHFCWIFFRKIEIYRYIYMF